MSYTFNQYPAIGTDGVIRSHFRNNGTNGWVVGAKWAAVTGNNGRDWKILDFPGAKFDDYLMDVCTIDDTFTILVSSRAQIYITNDNGTIFSKGGTGAFPDNQRIQTVLYKDSLNGVFAGDINIGYSTNGGITSTLSNSPAGFIGARWNDLYYENGTYYVVGYRAIGGITAGYSVDNGVNWSPFKPFGTYKHTLCSIAIFGTKVFFGGDHGYISSTDNLGITWTHISSPGTIVNLKTLGTTIVAINSAGSVFKSVDGGSTFDFDSYSGIQNNGFVDSDYIWQNRNACFFIFDDKNIWTSDAKTPYYIYSSYPDDSLSGTYLKLRGNKYLRYSLEGTNQQQTTIFRIKPTFPYNSNDIVLWEAESNLDRIYFGYNGTQRKYFLYVNGETLFSGTAFTDNSFQVDTNFSITWDFQLQEFNVYQNYDLIIKR